MAKVVLLNKPFNVLCQFTGGDDESTLADFVKEKNVYPAGRLDKDSEGLLILTDNGGLQNKIAHPKHKLPKTYWVQVEGIISGEALNQLGTGVVLKDGKTQPAKVKKISTPDVWERTPPVRKRENIPTSWIELTIKEGKNRQVRRMTAAVGFPTLRLVRAAIGHWQLKDLKPGEYKVENVHLPESQGNKSAKKGSPKRNVKKRIEK